MRREIPPRGFVPALRDLNTPELSSQVTKAFGLQGPPPLQLDPATQLGITLEDLTSIEFRYLRRAATFNAKVSVPLGVGFKAFAQLQGTPGTLTHVRRIIITNVNGTGQSYLFGTSRGNATTTGSFGATSADDRPGLAILNPATTMTFGNTTAVPFSPKGLFYLPTLSSVVIDVEAVLTGQVDTVGIRIAYAVVMVTAGNSLDVAFDYTERPLLPSET